MSKDHLSSMESDHNFELGPEFLLDTDVLLCVSDERSAFSYQPSAGCISNNGCAAP